MIWLGLIVDAIISVASVWAVNQFNIANPKGWGNIGLFGIFMVANFLFFFIYFLLQIHVQERIEK